MIALKVTLGHALYSIVGIQLETTRIGTLVLILVLVLFGIALCESSLTKAKTKGWFVCVCVLHYFF